MNLVNKNVLNLDRAAFFVMLVLLGIGIMMVYSASVEVAALKYRSSSFFLEKQILRIGFAMVFFYITLNLDYHWLSERSGAFIIIAIALLLFLVFSNNVMSVKGAKRWISLPGISLQPSDMARMALILALAKGIAKNEKGLQDGDMETLLSLLLLPAIMVILITLQPNFSTAMIVTAITGTLLFAGGLRLRFVAGAALAGIPVAVVMVLKTPYRLARLKAFMEPGAHAGSYQALQSLIGLGSGGIFGAGLGESSQKLLFLPEPYTDFVFSILGEEFGFVGVAVVFALFALLVFRGFRIARPDRLGYFLALGITVMFAYYVFIHAAVVSVLMPTTGIPLPFISYGGSNLLFNMIAMGILLNISGQSKRKLA